MSNPEVWYSVGGKAPTKEQKEAISSMFDEVKLMVRCMIKRGERADNVICALASMMTMLLAVHNVPEKHILELMDTIVKGVRHVKLEFTDE